MHHVRMLRSLHDLCRTHAQVVFFPRRVDVRDEHMIRPGEATCEIIQHCFGSGESVGLENDPQLPVRVPVSGHPDRGFDLCRMVSVIVHHDDPIGFTFYLEPAFRAVEIGQNPAGILRRDAFAVERCRHRRNRVGHVMHPR